MKRLIFIILYLTLFTMQLKGQQRIHDEQELQKFSYLMMFVTNDVPTKFATGFFVKKNQKLFFVSGYHCITLWDVYSGNRELPLSDTLIIRLYNKNSKEVYYHRMDIRKIIKESPMQYWHDKPDVYMLEVPMNLSETYEINTINDIDNTYSQDLGEIKKVVLFGFPNAKNIKYTRELDTLQSEQSAGNLIAEIGRPLYYPDLDKIDTINFKINITTNNLVLDGSSGSPIFFQFIEKKTNQSHYLFGGLVSGGDSLQKTATIVRPQYIIDL